MIASVGNLISFLCTGLKNKLPDGIVDMVFAYFTHQVAVASFDNKKETRVSQVSFKNSIIN